MSRELYKRQVLGEFVTEEDKIVESLYCNGYISLDERANIREYIKQLQQENQQLKEQLQQQKQINELEFNDFVKFKKEQEDNHLEKTDKLIKEKSHLRKALNEIREYIKDKQKLQYKFALSHIECDDILQIIDEVLEMNDENE